MPTAAKLVAALLFAAVGGLAAWFFLPNLPEGVRATRFPPSGAVLGAIIGWRVMGRLVGRGYANAVAQGIRTSGTLALLVLFLFSFREMILRAMKFTPHDVFETLLGMFDIAWRYLEMSATLPVWGTLIVGGVVAGLLAEAAHRRWT